MSDFITDNDRVEYLKQWWDNNGTALIIGLVVGIAIIFGWQSWKKHHTKNDLIASEAYQVILETSANNEELLAERVAGLIKSYPHTPYAALSSLMLAKSQVIAEQYAAAYQSLTWVIEHSKDNSMRQIARIRAARVLLAMDKPDEALNLLERHEDDNFNVLIDEVRGDIYAVQKNYPEAKKAYLKAQKENPDSPVLLPILQLKLSSLPSAQ